MKIKEIDGPKDGNGSYVRMFLVDGKFKVRMALRKEPYCTNCKKSSCEHVNAVVEMLQSAFIQLTRALKGTRGRDYFPTKRG